MMDVIWLAARLQREISHAVLSSALANLPRIFSFLEVNIIHINDAVRIFAEENPEQVLIIKTVVKYVDITSKSAPEEFQLLQILSLLFFN